MRNRIFKKTFALLVSFLLLVGMVPPVYALDNSIKVQFNGENISLDVAPQMVNGRILVPMRSIYEKLGATVEWNEQTGGIIANKDGIVVKLSVKSRDAYITKAEVEKKVQLDVAPTIVNGRTLVPVRFISESLGKQVGWDSENKTVIIVDLDYFMNKLKVQAPNFYEFINNRFESVSTGETNQSLEGAIKYNPSSTSANPDAASGSAAEQNIDVKFKAAINTKVNRENGSMDATINITGLQELLKGSGIENLDNIKLNVLFDNNSFYVKSSLFSFLEKQNIKVGDKWLKADIADLGIPDVNNLQDLKKAQGNQQYQDALRNLPMALDVNSFKESQALFDAVVPLVDNNHFTVTNNGDLKVYKWNITKQDLLNVVLRVEGNSGSFQDMSLQDLADMKKFVDSLKFDFNMEVGVKNNIIVSSKVSLSTQMDIPDTGHIEYSMKSDSQVLNPNNATYDIKIPDPSNVIDFKDLQPDNSIASIS